MKSGKKCHGLVVEHRGNIEGQNLEELSWSTYVKYQNSWASS